MEKIWSAYSNPSYAYHIDIINQCFVKMPSRILLNTLRRSKSVNYLYRNSFKFSIVQKTLRKCSKMSKSVGQRSPKQIVQHLKTRFSSQICENLSSVECTMACLTKTLRLHTHTYIYNSVWDSIVTMDFTKLGKQFVIITQSERKRAEKNNLMNTAIHCM